MNDQDTLQLVVSELQRRSGELRQLAQEAGLAYDTVLRIKNREGDPGYSKVKALADHLGISRARRQRVQVGFRSPCAEGAPEPQAEQGV